MGLTKQYLRYSQSATFGVVGTQKANVLFVELRGVRGKYAATAACEHVFVWDLRKSEKMLVLQGDKSEVSVLAKSPQGQILAVGYADGMVKVFSLTTGEVTVTFSGHKSAVTALSFDQRGLRLASGSKDTDVIIWDVVNESGLYRLKGHKGVVTQCQFMKERNILITSSKDTFVKFWDMDTQHCFKTLVGHRTEVWDFVLLGADQRLVTGAGDSELRVWDITFQDEESKEGAEQPAKKQKLSSIVHDEEDEEEEETSILSCKCVGSIVRKGRQRAVSLTIDSAGRVLCCHGADCWLEVFLVLTSEEKTKLLSKRQKKARKKSRESVTNGENNEEIPELLAVKDEIQPRCVLKASSKIRSFAAILENDATAVKLVLQLHNNSLETHIFQSLEGRHWDAEKQGAVALPGHRSDVRTVAFSSDNTTVLTGAGESVKIWNRATQQCIRSMKSGYALCSAFVVSERHCVIGTKTGHLELFDIAAGVLLERVEAHEGALWSIATSPDKRGFVTGSADKTLKFWDFELIKDEDAQSSKRLTVVHRRTLQMPDDVLCVKFTPDQKLIAVALLDSTVKVFFADTLKFFLALYGHKLPVLAMDISSDSTLIVTGSADRNVKIWGLDFGDCHRSMFAHDDSIMSLQFVPNTHLFFSVGKDKKIKQWDADHFEQITTLEGHHAEVWCLAVSPNGNYLVSGSHDKSLRLWERTQEPLVLEEEREMEREKAAEEALSHEERPTLPGQRSNSEVGAAGRQTADTVKAAERIMEALELYKEETAKEEEHEEIRRASKKEIPPMKKHPILQAYGNISPTRYVLEVIRKVKSSELEESLLVIPFSYVLELLPLLETFISSGWEVELACRCLLFLIRVHHGQITSSQSLLPIIDRLRSTSMQQVHQMRDRIGFNLAGLQFLQRELESRQEVQLFGDATAKMKDKNKKRKRKLMITLTS
ncbi:WD repeat-containing protein 3-like [Patiria miniata]|uniref:Small-subunit processome Utp12 domain-containing protein n=1 Tax=Patiria miniata TaxID=46514 RepID=A0A914A8B2_PATMI|nr:WD repeat-containing protein 3-like [Patiria miniata]XP_038059667.1 WD repeat-containing protein 3-like [Patiria miniata]